VGLVLRQETGTELDYLSTLDGMLCQRLTVPRNLLVLQVHVYLGLLTDPDLFTVCFRTAPNGGGSLVGGESSQVTIANYWNVFPWSWNRPWLTPGDVYLTLVPKSANHCRWYFGTLAGGGLFQDATRCAYLGATARPDDDFRFRILAA
jgi:hypothetical protein